MYTNVHGAQLWKLTIISNEAALLNLLDTGQAYFSTP